MMRIAPTALGFFRVAAAAAIWVLISNGHDIFAMILFTTAAASDWLDGHIARKYNVTSLIGAWTDFLADKILIGAALVALTLRGMMFPEVAVVIIGREVAVVLLRVFAAFLHEQIPPTLLGKRKMLIQCVAVIAALLWWPAHFAQGIAGVAALITMLSGMTYFWNARRLLTEHVAWWRKKRRRRSE